MFNEINQYQLSYPADQTGNIFITYASYCNWIILKIEFDNCNNSKMLMKTQKVDAYQGNIWMIQ